MNSIVLKTVIAVGCLAWIGVLLSAGTVHVDQTIQAGGAVHESRALWAPYGSAVTAASLFVWFFDKWLWAWPPFSWFVKRPDLRGTWHGEIVSGWINPQTNAPLPPIPAFVYVTETASTLYMRQFTAESESATLAASMLKDTDDADSVAVLYRNDSKAHVRERSPIHFGGMHLRVSGEDVLEGDYWTDRKTSGRIALKRISRAKCRSFADAQRLTTQAK
jgi:SMODS-associating 2TM, beta-strand rich effector domain